MTDFRVAHRLDAVERVAQDPVGPFPGLADGGAVAEEIDLIERDRFACGEGGFHRGLTRTFHADQLDSGASPVTVRHLLNHTSGVPDFLELYDVFDIEHYPESLDVLLDRIAIEPLRFEPGTEFHYSNSGYLYLGRIIEAVTGETWEEALAKRITGPLDLDRTWLTPPDNRGPLATGYLQLDGLVLPVSRLGRPDLAESAGGLTSTTSDLLAWVDAYMAGSVVDLDSVEEMLAPDLADYGLGWETIRVDGVEWHGHYGQTIGFCSALARQREHNATVILLSNRQDFPISHLHRQVMETLQRS